jgi:NAD(P)-dependent dehydrogenase (short-subunit alcohol dehydrogenase family)
MEVFRQAMETNFFGAVRCIKTVVPSMRQRRSGCIVNMTSVAGQFGMASLGPYASTKWALEGLSESLAQELKPFGIRVAMIEPGVVATPMTTKPRATIPAENPYYSSIRRLLAYFDGSLEDPTSPSEIAETVKRLSAAGAKPCEILRAATGPECFTGARQRPTKPGVTRRPQAMPTGSPTSRDQLAW